MSCSRSVHASEGCYGGMPGTPAKGSDQHTTDHGPQTNQQLGGQEGQASSSCRAEKPSFFSKQSPPDETCVARHPIACQAQPGGTSCSSCDCTAAVVASLHLHWCTASELRISDTLVRSLPLFLSVECQHWKEFITCSRNPTPEPTTRYSKTNPSL